MSQPETETQSELSDVRKLLAEKDEEISHLKEEIRLALGIGDGLLKEIKRLRTENAVLRQYGNKDCTAQADDAFAQLEGEKNAEEEKADL